MGKLPVGTTFVTESAGRDSIYREFVKRYEGKKLVLTVQRPDRVREYGVPDEIPVIWLMCPPHPKHECVKPRAEDIIKYLTEYTASTNKDSTDTILLDFINWYYVSISGRENSGGHTKHLAQMLQTLDNIAYQNEFALKILWKPERIDEQTRKDLLNARRPI